MKRKVELISFSMILNEALKISDNRSQLCFTGIYCFVLFVKKKVLRLLDSVFKANWFVLNLKTGLAR